MLLLIVRIPKVSLHCSNPLPQAKSNWLLLPLIVRILSKNSRYYNIIHQQPDIIIRQYGDVISQYQINVEMIVCLHLRYGFVCILFVYTKLHDLVQIKSPGVSQVLISGIALNKSCTDDTCWYIISHHILHVFICFLPHGSGSRSGPIRARAVPSWNARGLRGVRHSHNLSSIVIIWEPA